MQTVLESDLGVVVVDCPWCHYSLHAQLIVSEEATAEMYYKLKMAYERILFLQHYDSARINELTKLQYSPIIKRQKPLSPASVSGHELIVEKGPAIDDCACSCSGKGDDQALHGLVMAGPWVPLNPYSVLHSRA